MKKNFIQNRWKVMKICTAQLLMAIFFCSFTMAHTNYAQMLERRVTLSMENVNFLESLERIEAGAQVRFVYSASQFAGEEAVTINADGVPLRDIFEQLFTPRNIVFRVHEQEGTVTLRKEAGPANKKQSPKSRKEALQVSGIVSDLLTQQPMAGVNIIIKGTTQGTTSDNNGRYTLEAGENDVLVFSFIGYATLEIEVNGQAVVNAALQEDIQNLKEVTINAGYYTTLKEIQTGNIGRIDAQAIERQPVSNPLATLQGRIAGLEVTQTSGMPSGNFTVRIRGQNSIANGNDPLYIVDGVPFFSRSLSFAETSGQVYADGFGASPLNSINPRDIESIEVLKDADATAIYGSRGSNGVILITTRRGKKGKTTVDGSYREGIAQVAERMNVLGTPDYLAMRNEAFLNDGLTPDAGNAPDLVVYDQQRNTDWQDVLLGGRARFRDAQFSISGGENLTQFSVGTGYHKETSVFPGESSDQRISGHASVSNTSPGGKLKTNVSVTYSVNSTTLPKLDLTATALVLPPNAPHLHTPDGDLNWGADGWSGVGLTANPLGYTKSVFDSRTANFIGNATLAYTLLPGLEAKANLGYSSVTMRAFTTTPLSAIDPATHAFSQNNTVFSNSNFENWIVEPQLNWKKELGDGHLDLLAGTSFAEQVTDGSAQYATGFSSEALMRNINAAASTARASSHYSQYRYHAVFGRLNYTLKEKYIINITGRRDGSSRFGPGRQFANFGAVGMAWIFSREAFLASTVPFLSHGKLRVTYGSTGNDQLGDYQYLDTYSPSGSGAYNGTVGLRPQRLFNPEFGWETVRKFETGIDAAFADNRYTFAVNYYRNRSSNQLIGTPLPATTGFTTIQSNFPAIIENRGFEIEAGAEIIRREKFTWSASFNMSIPRNELVKFPGLESSPYANQYAEGEPLSISKLYRFTQVNPETGLYEFEDVDGDGTLTAADRTAIKFRGREYYGGLGTSLRYGTIQLDALIEFVRQTGPNYLSYYAVTPGGQPLNVSEYSLDRWKATSDVRDVQRYSTTGSVQAAYGNLRNSDRAVSDASFLRLKNISLSWSVPDKWTSKIRFENVRLFLQVQNLLMLMEYEGLHPENQFAVLPPLRVITAGLQVKL